jgi:hypothetical protein
MSADITKYLRVRVYRNRNLFFIILESGKSKFKALGDFMRDASSGDEGSFAIIWQKA